MAKPSMQIELDNDIFLDLLATKIAKILAPQIYQKLIHDEIRTRDYLQSEVFHCGDENIKRIVKQPNFPTMYLGTNKNPSYSLKAVDEWIKKNQIYQ